MTKWTADDIPAQAGRVAVITGANSGIGFEMARELARKGGTVVMACRSEQRGQRALARIRAELPGAAVELAQVDMDYTAAELTLKRAAFKIKIPSHLPIQICQRAIGFTATICICASSTSRARVPHASQSVVNPSNVVISVKV